MDTPNRGWPQIFSAAKSFYGHPRPTPISVEYGYNEANEDSWQRAPGIESAVSFGIHHSLILAALLNQMRNQAHLPPLPWLDNYFPMCHPLWDGILTFEQIQGEDPSGFLQENQELEQLYLGPPANGPIKYSREEGRTQFGMDH